jgi:hypothetical protein
MPDPSKVFKIARLPHTLVIVPQGATMNFQYTDVHLESNELFRIIDEPGLDNVLIDLGAVTYIDSIIISCEYLPSRGNWAARESSAVPMMRSRKCSAAYRSDGSGLCSIHANWHSLKSNPRRTASERRGPTGQ